MIDGVKAAGVIDIFVANAGAAATGAGAQNIARHVGPDDRGQSDQRLSVFARSDPANEDARLGDGSSRLHRPASLKAYPYTGAYAAAKHGLLGWVKSLALELGKTGVTANAICPGFTDTPLVDDALDNIVAKTKTSREDALAGFVKDNPMGRLIKPQESRISCFMACGATARPLLPASRL